MPASAPAGRGCRWHASIWPMRSMPRSTRPSALLHHYRRAIAFRHAHRALAKGALDGLAAAGNVLSFRRGGGDEEIFCAFNLGEAPATITLPAGTWVPVGSELNRPPHRRTGAWCSWGRGSPAWR